MEYRNDTSEETEAASIHSFIQYMWKAPFPSIRTSAIVHTKITLATLDRARKYNYASMPILR